MTQTTDLFRKWAEYGFGEHGLKHSLKMAIFPASSGKNRMSQRVEHRGSLNSVHLWLSGQEAVSSPHNFATTHLTVCILNLFLLVTQCNFRNGPNTVSESTVSNTELSEFFGPHRVRGANSVSWAQPIICVPKRTHRVFFSQNSPSLPQNSVSSLFRNSTLETVVRPFPIV